MMTKHFSFRINCIVLLLFMILSLSGCTSFVDLSEEESKQIVSYSTNVLNDHNSAVKGSLKNLSKTDLRDIVIKDDPGLISEIALIREEATAEAEEAQKPKNKPEDKAGETGEAKEEKEDKPLEVENADIASLIGLQGFSVEYEGHRVQDSYPDDVSDEAEMIFSIEPATANDKLLVLYFNVKNLSDTEADCNIMALAPKFRFRADGKVHSFLNTLLLDDLSTFQMNMEPGGTERVVLTAEISNEKAEELSDLSLIIIGDTDNTEITLEKQGQD